MVKRFLIRLGIAMVSLVGFCFLGVNLQIFKQVLQYRVVTTLLQAVMICLIY